jgi:hypothetical protein
MSKRFAQFGGTGGQYQPFSPGGSPEFRGGPSGYANFNVNNFSHDLSLDTLMSRTHKPNILGFERPLECLLEMFHDDLERDAEPYLLNQQEREKLNFKKKIRNKHQYLYDLAHPEKTNDNENNKKIIKKLKTVEELLSKFRKNENIDFSKFASVYDEVNEGSLDTKLNKLHKNNPDSFYRREPSLPAYDESLEPTQDYDSEGDSLNLKKTRLTEPFTGQDPQYKPQDGLDKYQKDLMNPYFPNEHNLVDSELLMNYPDTAENEYHVAPNTFADLTSNTTPESTNNNLTLQQKLQKLKKKYPTQEQLETGLGKLDWDENTKGTTYDRNVTYQTPYAPDGFGTISNPASVGPGPAGAGAYPIAGYL